MFTGIIKNIGTITNITTSGSNKTFTIKSSLTPHLNIDESIAHNGVCLTVIAIENDTYQVTAIKETLDITTLGQWQLNDAVNLEQAMMLNARLDGHFVQGHVDTKAICKNILNENGSWLYTFEIDIAYKNLIIEKGSICINGTSLTCFNLTDTTFQVAIIPYTYEHTTIHLLKVNDSVNIEFDMIGKYLERKHG
jgi:riboflavin synthase